MCEEEVTFLKKSNQKTSGPAGLGDAGAPAPRSKSFLVTFFQKRNLLLPLSNKTFMPSAFRPALS
jgi:hypothetical protein